MLRDCNDCDIWCVASLLAESWAIAARHFACCHRVASPDDGRNSQFGLSHPRRSCWVVATQCDDHSDYFYGLRFRRVGDGASNAGQPSSIAEPHWARLVCSFVTCLVVETPSGHDGPLRLASMCAAQSRRSNGDFQPPAVFSNLNAQLSLNGCHLLYS